MLVQRGGRDIVKSAFHWLICAGWLFLNVESPLSPAKDSWGDEDDNQLAGGRGRPIKGNTPSIDISSWLRPWLTNIVDQYLKYFLNQYIFLIIFHGCNGAIFLIYLYESLLYKMTNAKTTRAEVKTADMVCLEVLLQRSESHMHNHTSENPESSNWPFPEITILISCSW